MAGPPAAAGRAASGGGGGGGALAPEVVAFDEFVRERGEWGGWERDDHEAFEGVLRACGGDYTQAVQVRARAAWAGVWGGAGTLWAIRVGRRTEASWVGAGACGWVRRGVVGGARCGWWRVRACGVVWCGVQVALERCVGFTKAELVQHAW